MIRQHGCRYPDRIVIPLSQREIARRLGISPGTLTWYLNELGDAVVARRPLLTFHPSFAPVDERAVPRAPAANSTVEGLLSDLLDAVEANNELLRLTLVELVDARGDRRPDRAVGSRERATEPRESVARSDQKEKDEPLLPGLSRSRDHADRVARSRDDLPSAAEVEDLLSPLEATVRRCRLVPVGDRSRLRKALAPYTAEQIAAAVARIVSDIARGVPVRSPYGLLIHKAEDAYSDYFDLTPWPAAPPPAGTPTTPVEEPDELDRLAELALGEMDSDPIRWANDLAGLSTEIDHHIRTTGGAAAETLLTCDPYRLAVRQELYRARLAEETQIR